MFNILKSYVRYAGKLTPTDIEANTRKTDKYVHVDGNIPGVKV